MGVRAYILVRAPRDAENIVDYLSNLDIVERADLVYGGYDVVATVNAPSLEEIGSILLGDIRKRFDVESTLTLIVARRP